MALERTFDIAVQLSLGMEILKPPEELTDDDGDILLSEDAGLHLQGRVLLESKGQSGGGNRDRMGDRPGGLTRSEHEPPEQYLSERRVGSAGRQPTKKAGREDGWKYALHNDPKV